MTRYCYNCFGGKQAMLDPDKICEQCRQREMDEAKELKERREMGWECPKCSAVMAPSMLTCCRCIGEFGIKPGYVNPFIHGRTAMKNGQYLYDLQQNEK